MTRLTKRRIGYCVMIPWFAFWQLLSSLMWMVCLFPILADFVLEDKTTDLKKHAKSFWLVPEWPT